MESGTSGDRRILVAGGRGRHATKETDNGRSGKRKRRKKKEKKEGEEGTRARNISNAPSSVAKIRFQASIARAHAPPR